MSTLESLKKMFENLNNHQKEKFLEEVFGEQKVLITVMGGVAEVDAAPANVSVEINDLDH